MYQTDVLSRFVAAARNFPPGFIRAPQLGADELGAFCRVGVFAA